MRLRVFFLFFLGLVLLSNDVVATGAIQLTPFDDLKSVTLADKIQGLAMVGERPSVASPSPCNFSGAQGTVLQATSSHALVLVIDSDWEKRCKGLKGVRGLPMVWVPLSELNPQKKFDRSTHGRSLCEAYKTYEKSPLSLPQVHTEAQGSCEGHDCAPQKGPKGLAQLGAQLRDEAIRYVANDMNSQNRREGFNFEKLVDEVLARANRHVFPDQKRRECIREIRRLTCERSPWAKVGLQDRFKFVLALSQKHFALRGGARNTLTIPCVAAVETGTLDPFTKNEIMCTPDARGQLQPRMHTYHGLGMLTLSTLTYYLSRDHRILGKFRSKIPEFQKNSYYACPEDLHADMAYSAELQIELMAYTLLEKGSDFAAYNAHEAIDANGKAHKDNYSEAVKSCVSCLSQCYNPDGTWKKNLKSCEKNKEGQPDPSRCLSHTLRLNTEEAMFKHRASDQFYQNHEARARSCEEIRSGASAGGVK